MSEQNKLSSVVYSQNSGTMAICRLPTRSLLRITLTMTLRRPILGAARIVKRGEQHSTAVHSPTFTLTIEDVIAEGETVMTRWSCRGTHKGDLNGIAPTGEARSPSPA